MRVDCESGYKQSGSSNYLSSHNTTNSISQVGAHQLKFSPACTLIVFNKKHIIKKTCSKIPLALPPKHTEHREGCR
uniref:Uncharacterized protein n=1 Tax=Zea mays TaxID=4577 RepID=C4J0K3_MAIZE|nr:unknown [Zea mays]